MESLSPVGCVALGDRTYSDGYLVEMIGLHWTKTHPEGVGSGRHRGEWEMVCGEEEKEVCTPCPPGVAINASGTLCGPPV